MTDTHRKLESARLYFCTPIRRDPHDHTVLEKHIQEIASACNNGVDIVQIRDKNNPYLTKFGPLLPQEYQKIYQGIRALTQNTRTLLAVNDDPHLARLVDADILHLGQEDIRPEKALKIVQKPILIGQSTHSFEEFTAAQKDPLVHYCCLGPVFSTPTKPGRPAIGDALIRRIGEKQWPKPWFIIGGITTTNLSHFVKEGIQRAVVVRAISETNNYDIAARALKELLTGS